MADTSTERDGRAEVDAFVAALPEAFRECFAMARAQVLASAEGISERIAWQTISFPRPMVKVSPWPSFASACAESVLRMTYAAE